MLIHRYFEKYALKSPSAPAVQYEDDTPVTYAELNKQSNQLAHYLCSQSVTLGDKVAVCTLRSVDQVVIFLALSKIGAIYVPVAPSQTTYNLLQEVVHSCDAKLLLGHRACIQNKLIDIVETVYLEDITPLLGFMPDVNPATTIRSTDIVYIAHSSGTTGKPKAIPIQHAGLEYWGRTQEALFLDINAQSRILGFISMSFDAHLWEYLMTWVKGACLYIASSATVEDSSRLVKFLSEHKITDATLIPTVLRALNLEKSLRSLHSSGLTNIYSTGESCTQDMVRIFEHNNVNLWNCYGPTELTFGITAYRVFSAMLDKDGSVPIGKPHGDEIKMHILTPEQVPSDNGELYIESPYLTPGYLNPQDNNGRIVDIVLNGKPVRLFKTGDHVFCADGRYYCKGRFLDAHVKINGQLVEIVGVENVLRNYPGIHDVALLVYKNHDTDQNQLVACCATNDKIDEFLIKEYLHSKITAVSVPSWFIFKKNLPRTVNGKVDRQLLITELEQRHERIVLDNTNISVEKKPRNALEYAIANIWNRILYGHAQDVFEIDITMDYAHQGGNSVNVMYMRNKIEEKFGITISVQQLCSIHALNIAKLANFVYEWSALQHRHHIIETIRDSEQPGVFFIPPITGSSSVYCDFIKKLRTSRTVHVLHSPSLFLDGVFATDVCAIARSYVTMIQEKQPKGPYALIGWSFGGTVAWEMAAQFEYMQQEVDFFCIIDSVSPSIHRRLNSADHYNALVKMIQNLPHITIGTGLYNMQCFLNLSQDQQIIQAFEFVRSGYPEGQKIIDIVKSHAIAYAHYCPALINRTHPYIISSAETQKMMMIWMNSPMPQHHLGWSVSTQTESVYDSVIPGDHFSMLSNQRIVQYIDDRLPDTAATAATRTLQNNTKQTELARLLSENYMLRSQLNLLLARSVTIPVDSVSTRPLRSVNFSLFAPKTKQDSPIDKSHSKPLRRWSYS